MKRLGDVRLDVRVVDDGGCRRCGGTGMVDVPGELVTFKNATVSRLEPCPDCQRPQCPTCGGLGYVRYDLPVDHPGFGQLHRCPENCAAVQQMDALRRTGLRKYSKLPEEYAGLSFATFDALPEVVKAGKLPARIAAGLFVDAADQQHWVNRAAVGGLFTDDPGQDDWRNWLVLYGPHGRGKTGLAAAIVNALTDMNKAVLYIRLQDFVEAVQKRYSREREYDDEFGATPESVKDSVKNAPILVIDEFDVPQLTDNKRDIVESVIRYRHGERLPTIITTNLSPKALDQRWGATIASVIRARAHWIELSGASLRPVENSWEFDS